MSYYISHKTLVARQEPVVEAPSLSTPAIVGIAVGSFFAVSQLYFICTYALCLLHTN